MAKKILLKDNNNVELMPITRGELVLDSSGNNAFHSSEFLASLTLSGLMSAEDKKNFDKSSVAATTSTTYWGDSLTVNIKGVEKTLIIPNKPTLADLTNNLTSLGNVNVGSVNQPVYFKNGVPTSTNVLQTNIHFNYDSNVRTTWESFGINNSIKIIKLHISPNINNISDWEIFENSPHLLFGYNVKGYLGISATRTITSVVFGGGYSSYDKPWYWKLKGTDTATYTLPTKSSTLASTDDIPTKTSQLIKDDVYMKSEVYSMSLVNDLINALDGVVGGIVDTWRPIHIKNSSDNTVLTLGNGSTSGDITIKAGTNLTATVSDTTVTLDTTYNLNELNTSVLKGVEAYNWGNHVGKYLPLSGGQLTNSNIEILSINSTSTNQYTALGFYKNSTRYGGIAISSTQPTWRNLYLYNSDFSFVAEILHTRNYTVYVNETNFPGINKTGTITSITAGTGLSGGTITTSGTISLATVGTIAGNFGLSANANPGYSGTFKVPYLTVDNYGRVTAISEKIVTMPSAQSIPTLSGGSSASADATVVGGVTVNGHAITVGKKTIKGSGTVNVTGTSSDVTISSFDSLTSICGTIIPNGSDLNDFSTFSPAGVYYTKYASNTDTLLNCPISSVAIKLISINNNYTNNNWSTQLLISSDRILYRNTTSNSFTNWHTLVHSLNNTTIGSYTNPVFCDSNGVIRPCTYSLNKTVPADAVFTDTKVTQTITSSNDNYPLLLAPSGQTATTTTTAYFDNGVTLNPSTNTITANISGNAATASLVAWSNVSDKPTKLSDFTKDVGFIYGYGTLIPANADINDETYQAVGIYTSNGSNISATIVNTPYTKSGFRLITLRGYMNHADASQAYGTQLAITSGPIFWRSLGASNNNPSVWYQLPYIGTNTIGNNTTPIYYKGNGTFATCAYTLGKSVPSDAVFTDTHHVTRLYIGKSGTVSNTDTRDPYLKVTDNNTYRNQIRIKGTGNTSVVSDPNGVITINSADTYTGTVTSVKVGTTSYSPSSGVISLPAYPNSLPASGGNADTAIKLKTARTLWGLSFDGSANVNGNMTGVGSISMSKALTLTGTESYTSHIQFSRSGWNYITIPDGGTDTKLAIGKFTSSSNTYYWFDNESFSPQTTNVHTLGTSTNVWANVYATTFIGNLDGTYVNKLTGYTKATSASNIVATDSLNTAIGKLEYKAGTTYDWYKSITQDDTDTIINKWGEIVDFIDSVAEGTDITDEFVTRKTEQIITGAKIFQDSVTISYYASFILSGSENSNIYHTNHNPQYNWGNANSRAIGMPHALNFKWYDNVWNIGALRGGSTNTTGFGIGLSALDSDGNFYIKSSFRIDETASYVNEHEIYHTGNLPTVLNQSLANYVTLNTEQTITGKKVFKDLSVYGDWENDFGIRFLEGNMPSYGFAFLYGQNDVFRLVTSDNYVTDLEIFKAYRGSNKITFTGDVTASKFITSNGINSQFVKGDGSLDSNTYATITLLGLYLPLSGGTLTGNISITIASAPAGLDYYIGNSRKASIKYNQDNNVSGLMMVNRAADRFLVIEDAGTLTFGAAIGRNMVLHSGNYTDYTVTKTGTGASGTWNININGDAKTLNGISNYTKYKGFSITSKKARIPIGVNTQYLITLRGTNGGRAALVYVTGYASGGTAARITIRHIYCPSYYKFYINGSSEESCIYLEKTYYLDTSDEGTITILNGNVPNVTIVDSIPSDATLATIDSNIMAVRSDIPTKLSQLTDDVVTGKYLPLSGGDLIGDVSFIMGNTDKFINWAFSTSERIGSSWRAGVLGTGGGDTNYYTIQSGTTDESGTWYTALRIGQNTFDAGFGGNVYPLVTNTKTLGTSSLKWKNIYATTFTGNLTGNAATATTATKFSGQPINKFMTYEVNDNYLAANLSATESKKAVDTYIEYYDGALGGEGWFNCKWGTITAINKFVKAGGTANQFLKADGSVDSTSYATSASLSNYLPLTGGTLSGNLILSGDRPAIIRNIKRNTNGGWTRVMYALQVDSVTKFTIAGYGNYTINASDNDISYVHMGCNSWNGLNLRISPTELKWGDHTIWHSGNDGATSGLNADLLDGYHASSFALKTDLGSAELANNITTISKTLTVGTDWMSTGIDGDDLETGSYIVQVHAHNESTFYDCYWTGTLSWWKGRTNDTKADEIVLHRTGRGYIQTIYLRTIMRSNTDTNGLLLLIAASSALTSCTYTFKFKRVI